MTEEVFNTKNKICALLAVSFLGFRSCRSCIALRPRGVAALSKPNMLAAIFMVTDPIAGWLLGTSGMSCLNKGRKALVNNSTKPARSAIVKKPNHKHSTPTKPSAISTLKEAISKVACTTCAKIALLSFISA